MPMGLDSPSPLSPAGYQEQMPQGNMPPLPTGTKRDPFQAVRKLALQMDPSLTRHDLDYLMHVLDMEGLTEKIYKPEFPGLLAPLVKRIAGSVGRITSRAIGYNTAVSPAITQPLVR